MRDAQNPAAVAYANQRLAALRQQGYTPQMFGLHGDPTSLWRQMSPLVGAMRSGGSYLQQPRPNVNPQIGAVIAAQQSAYNNPDAPDAISPMSGGVASDPAQMSNVYGRVVPPPLAAGAAGVIGHPFDTSRLAPFHPNHQLPQLVIPARTRSRMHSNYNDLKTRFLRSVAQNRGRGGRILAG